MILFADDTNCLFTGENIDLLIPEINLNLNNINTWFQTNKLSLNTEKTNYIIFKHPKQLAAQTNINIEMNNEKIAEVRSVKFLGVN